MTMEIQGTTDETSKEDLVEWCQGGYETFEPVPQERTG